MLTLLGGRSGLQCDGSNRRDFLKVGALATMGLTLPDLLRARAASKKAGKSTKSTSVVWLWLGGGPTHVETFDPKPDAPVEFRSTVGQVQTNVPGVQIGGVFPKMAQVADKMAFVRSFAHTNSGHGGGTHFVMTGYNFIAADNGSTPIKPGYGAILSKYRGPNNPSTGMPNYVRLGSILGDGPAWLGPTYAPFDVSGKGRANMAPQVALERIDDRRNLLKSLDTINREIDQSGLMNGLDDFESQAFELLRSTARDAFDIKQESQANRDRYGKGLGEQLLVARRLCEAGVGFVTLNYGGWDMHGNIANSMKSRAPAMDQAVSTFLTDLAERGMSDDVLLVISGEFGRTPRINKGAGRDHWAPLSTLALAGGGLRMGQVVGESTDKAERPKSTPIGPQDLMATIFHVLGIPQDLHFKDPSGRPMPMIQGGKPIVELV